MLGLEKPVFSTRNSMKQRMFGLPHAFSGVDALGSTCQGGDGGYHQPAREAVSLN